LIEKVLDDVFSNFRIKLALINWFPTYLLLIAIRLLRPDLKANWDELEIELEWCKNISVYALYLSCT